MTDHNAEPPEPKSIVPTVGVEINIDAEQFEAWFDLLKETDELMGELPSLTRFCRTLAGESQDAVNLFIDATTKSRYQRIESGDAPIESPAEAINLLAYCYGVLTAATKTTFPEVKITDVHEDDQGVVATGVVIPDPTPPLVDDVAEIDVRMFGHPAMRPDEATGGLIVD